VSGLAIVNESVTVPFGANPSSLVAWLSPGLLFLYCAE